MFQLQPGQLSEPVRSVFGMHLIQLLERKREPLTEQRLRTAARMVLRTRSWPRPYRIGPARYVPMPMLKSNATISDAAPHIARKRFGQNFLHDPTIIARIIAAIRPRPGDRIVRSAQDRRR